MWTSSYTIFWKSDLCRSCAKAQTHKSGLLGRCDVIDVRSAPIPIKFCIAAKCRDVPDSDIAFCQDNYEIAGSKYQSQGSLHLGKPSIRMRST